MKDDGKGTEVGTDLVERDRPEAAVTVSDQNVGDTVRASWPFSLHTINNNISHCSAEGREALRAAFLWCTDSAHPVRRSEFSRRVGYDENTIYKIYTGRYVEAESKRQLDVPKKLVSAIREFLDLERERFLGGKTEFVITPSVKRVWHGCHIARESKTPVFITGPSHLGKTCALVRYCQQNNHGKTIYVRMKAASGLGGMIRRIAERVGVSPNSNTANLTDYIKKALNEDMVLILDEVHLLAYTYRKASFFACVEVIREIYDESQCGLVLCGTTLLDDEMKARELEQLMRRGVHRIKLPSPTRADVMAICGSVGLEFPERSMEVRIKDHTEQPYELLRQLAQTSGMKSITERIRYARKLASKAKDKLSWQWFVEAHLTIAAEQDTGDGWK